MGYSHNNFFVISDPHGAEAEFRQILKHFDATKEQLLLLGDYIDRGNSSLNMVKLVKQLHEEQGAIVLKGNHEDMFLQFLKNPEQSAYWYYKYGGWSTVNSFMGEEVAHLRYPPRVIANKIQEQHAELIAFIAALPLYHEAEEWIFVHAGFNPFRTDWRSSKDEFLVIRDQFYCFRNESNRNVMFGHTPVVHLPKHDGFPIWIDLDKRLYGIDGGQEKYGHLNGVRIAQGEVVTVYCSSFGKEATTHDVAAYLSTKNEA